MNLSNNYLKRLVEYKGRKQKVSTFIASYRRDNKLSIKEFADLIGVTPIQVYRMETDDEYPLRYKQIEAIERLINGEELHKEKETKFMGEVLISEDWIDLIEILNESNVTPNEVIESLIQTGKLTSNE